jgi:GT2 family glycosyltransferase
MVPIQLGKCDPDVSILVVSFNTREMTLACLESVLEHGKLVSFEVVVVDNASTDGSAAGIAAEFPQVRLIPSSVNLGFAAANNLAAENARGRYLLLLNPDTVVTNGAIERLLGFAEEHPQAGIYGGRTVFGDGRLNPTSCWRETSVFSLLCRATGLSGAFKGSAWLNSDSYGGWNRDSVRQVDIVSGCFMLIRRDLWAKLGGFDTSYFMYGEDWDLCLRARRLGAYCLFCPEAEIVHYGGASERVRADKIVRLFSAQVKLYRRHAGFVRSRILVTLLLLWTLRASFLRAAGELMRGSSLGLEAVAWRNVWQRRKEWLEADRRQEAYVRESAAQIK